MYYSAYAPDDLAALTGQLARHDGETWCIFDNTADGAANEDACTVHAELLGMDSEPSPA